MGLRGKINLRRIKDLEVGETGYALPVSALGFDVDNKPYLNLNDLVEKEIGSIRCLIITRTGVGKRDYDVDMRHVDYDLVKGKEKGNPFPSDFAGEEDVVQLEYDNPLDAISSKDIDEFIKNPERK